MMKASKFKMALSAVSAAAAAAVLSFAVVGCDDSGKVAGNNGSDGYSPPSADSYLHKAPAEKLLEKKWKTIGAVDVKTGALTQFEPKDCQECYTLTYLNDSLFASYSSANNGFGTYNYEGHNVQVTEHFATEVMEIGDGIQWNDVLMRVDFFTLLEKELRLYYNDKQNYLLLKQQ